VRNVLASSADPAVRAARQRMRRANSADVIAPLANDFDSAIVARDAAMREDVVRRLLRERRPALLDALEGTIPAPAARAAPSA